MSAVETFAAHAETCPDCQRQPFCSRGTALLADAAKLRVDHSQLKLPFAQVEEPAPKIPSYLRKK